MLVDSHCHLDFFNNLEEVVRRAVENNVNTMVSCSTNLESIKKHLKFQNEFKEVKICLGIHPSDILRMSKEEIEKSLELLKKNLQNCVAVGEIGMDFKHGKTSEQKKIQEEIFRIQIKIALDNNLPTVVHSRFAELKTMEILKEEGAKKILMHWFSNSNESVKRAKELGYLMSCGPIILSSKQSLEVAKNIPLENLLLETDAPVAFLGKQSEPFWINRVVEKLSDEKRLKNGEIAKKTTKNAMSFFGLND